MKINFKIYKLSAKVRVCDSSQNFKITKTPYSVPFIKKTLVNHVYIRIWSSLLTFTVLQWMKTNSKISQFSSFVLRSGYAIQVKISKWLKLLNSFPFINKTLVNHLYIWIWSIWLTFTACQWMKTDFIISKFEDFCEGPGFRFL